MNIRDIQGGVMASVDAVFAENIRASFMDARGMSDPARPQTEFKAVLRTGASKSSKVEGFTSSVRATGGTLHLDPAQAVGLVFRKNDKIRALDRPGEPLFQVIAVDDRGASRLVLHLGEA